MNLGTSAVKVGVGAATGNPQLAMQGLTDAGGYVMSEAQEVDGPNDGVGQKIGKEDYMKLGTDIVSGIGAYAMGKQGAEGVGDGTGTGGDGTGGGSFLDTIASGAIPEGATAATQAGGTGPLGMLKTLVQNPEFIQMLMQLQNPAGQTTAAGTLGALANLNTHGSKLKRSTRQHDYIKGNTRGYR